MAKYVPKVGDRVRVVAMAKDSAWYDYIKEFRKLTGTLTKVYKSCRYYGKIGYYFVEILYDEDVGPYPHTDPFCVGDVRLKKVE